ncbi:MAG TPA: elongation factor P [Terriglobales bacterium]|nr:elongation factor P [Terriglobales bacterium]
MITASQLRPGMAVRIEGQIYEVLESAAKAGGGQLGGVVKTKLRNLISGRFWDSHFRPEERLEELEVDRQNMEFLYSDDENCIFMHPQSFEQVEVPRRALGEAQSFLQAGTTVPVEFFEGRPIRVVLPEVVEIRIADTADPVHTGQDNTWKEARLENGVQIHVPLFIARGELVRVDVKSGRYLERVRLERKKGA